MQIPRTVRTRRERARNDRLIYDGTRTVAVNAKVRAKRAKAAKAYARLRRMRGKIRFSRTWKELKEDR